MLPENYAFYTLTLNPDGIPAPRALVRYFAAEVRP